MTHPFRKRRLVLFAASTAVAAGAVLVPTTAFAATPAAPHTVMADSGAGDAGNQSTEGGIKIAPKEGQPVKVRPGKWGDSKWGKNRPGKHGISHTKVAAPCEESVRDECVATAEPVTVGRGNVGL